MTEHSVRLLSAVATGIYSAMSTLLSQGILGPQSPNVPPKKRYPVLPLYSSLVFQRQKQKPIFFSQPMLTTARKNSGNTSP